MSQMRLFGHKPKYWTNENELMMTLEQRSRITEVITVHPDVNLIHLLRSFTKSPNSKPHGGSEKSGAQSSLYRTIG